MYSFHFLLLFCLVTLFSFFFLGGKKKKLEGAIGGRMEWRRKSIFFNSAESEFTNVF